MSLGAAARRTELLCRGTGEGRRMEEVLGEDGRRCRGGGEMQTERFPPARPSPTLLSLSLSPSTQDEAASPRPHSAAAVRWQCGELRALCLQTGGFPRAAAPVSWDLSPGSRPSVTRQSAGPLCPAGTHSFLMNSIVLPGCLVFSFFWSAF